MLAAQLINNLFEQAGITDQKEIQDKLAQVKDFATMEVEDDLANRLIGKDRMSVDAAKNNGDLKSYFTALALNGVDAEVNNAITTYGLNADDFKDEKSSYKKITLALQKAQEKLKTDLGKGKTDNKELVDKINSLTADLATKETAHQSQVNEINASHTTTLNKMQIDNLLRGYKYAHEMDIEDNVLIASNKVHSELASKGLKYVNENGSLNLQKEDGTKYFDGNKEIDLKTFTDTVLSSNKLLATTNPNPAPTPTPAPSGNGNSNGWDTVAAKANAAYEAAK